jgi:ribosomal protein L7Ae-like RNA K-turn-binding protein
MKSTTAWRRKCLEKNDRLMNLLGLARKAGKLELGSEAVKQTVRRRRAALVLLCADLSPKSAQSIREEAEKAGVKAMELPAGMDTVQAALGQRAGVLAVKDSGFAEALLKLYAEDRGGTIL